MGIKTFAMTNLRNEEHYQFQMEFDALVKKYTAAKLGAEAFFAEHTPLVANEYTALNVIHKSAVTDDLSDADAVRDATFRGIADTIKAACNHFDEAKQAAAQRLMVIFDTYGNVALKPYDDETAALTKLTFELINTYSNDIEILGIDNWVEKLQQQNNAFDTLKKERYSEDASKTHLVMKEVRTKVDASYKSIVSLINALIVVNGDTAYSGFVNELNTRIDAYALILAQRQGRNAKTTKTDSTTNTSTNK